MVTLKWTTFLRSFQRTINTYRTLKVTVGTVKKTLIAFEDQDSNDEFFVQILRKKHDKKGENKRIHNTWNGIKRTLIY